MVELVYCVDENPLGETKHIKFPILQDATRWIAHELNGILKRSAGYSVYTVVPDGDLPETLYNWSAKIY